MINYDMFLDFLIIYYMFIVIYNQLLSSVAHSLTNGEASGDWKFTGR